MPIKTGECFWVDEEGRLWRADSYRDGAGVVTTEQVLIAEAPEPSPEA
ncbi:MAG: hypothetical protein ACOYLQ_09505 [Hyphomicrobiaceae bacterium]